MTIEEITIQPPLTKGTTLWRAIATISEKPAAMIERYGDSAEESFKNLMLEIERQRKN